VLSPALLPRPGWHSAACISLCGAVSLEFTVNEKSNAPYTSPERRSYEQLIRRLLKLPGRPAIMLLHHYGYWEAAGDGLDRGLFYREPEEQLTAFAHVSGLLLAWVHASDACLVHGSNLTKYLRHACKNDLT
jgi:hypothetical protein